MISVTPDENSASLGQGYALPTVVSEVLSDFEVRGRGSKTVELEHGKV